MKKDKKESSGSILLDALQGIDIPEEEQQQQPEGQQGKAVETPEKIEKKEEGQAENVEDDDDDIKPPLSMSGKPSQQWEKLKSNRDKWQARANEAASKLKEFEAKVAEAESIKADLLKERGEREKIKQDLDAIQFESTDEFRKAFVDPITEITTKVERLIPKGLSAETLEELKSINLKMSPLAGQTGSENDYYSAVDEFADLAFTSKSLKDKFSSLMGELWERAEALRNAKTAKLEERDRILKKNNVGVEAVAERFYSVIDDDLASFEKENPGRISAWNEDAIKKVINYNGKETDGFKAAKGEIAKFIKTKELTPEVRKILLNGAMHHTYEKETDLLRQTIAFQVKESKKYAEEIERLKGIIESRGYSKPSHNKSESAKSVKPDYSRSILAEAIESVASGT